MVFRHRRPYSFRSDERPFAALVLCRPRPAHARRLSGFRQRELLLSCLPTGQSSLPGLFRIRFRFLPDKRARVRGRDAAAAFRKENCGPRTYRKLALSLSAHSRRQRSPQNLADKRQVIIRRPPGEPNDLIVSDRLFVQHLADASLFFRSYIASSGRSVSKTSSDISGQHSLAKRNNDSRADLDSGSAY